MLDTVASRDFSSEKELLFEVVNEIVALDEIDVSGGRIWQLDEANYSYKLLFQANKSSEHLPNVSLRIDENPVFDLVSEKRTVLGDETDKHFLRKGLLMFSASGIGSKIKLKGKRYYTYILAVHSDSMSDELRYSLNVVATLLTSKIKERNNATAQKSLADDLTKAQQLQKSILPEHELLFHDYQIFGVTVPAQILGGDFFDYLKIGRSEKRIGIVVGDAASKGISAAAEAMYISGAVRMASMFQLKISPMMNRVNNLVNKIFSDDRFATMFYGEISNDRHGLCLYANAGHNPPIFINSKKKEVTYLYATGPLLGPVPDSGFETDSLIFNKGDILVIYSDGITEAQDQNSEPYDEKRLEKIILDSCELSAKEITYKILEDVQKFSAFNSKYQDDKTVVVIKKKKDELN